ncbi:hypothetical protein AOQ84DRAFT_7380 [Glonium stellatum]|uniref:General transcription and DNA repair factor IIH subunit TFB5 n=1 Tax=Glonium stellatum TaxID=574774 RepID=A0A8E2F509_9PEZI|nr:hypothetical protein AOQ84DRAFT_7380 [Glonium stellatum]
MVSMSDQTLQTLPTTHVTYLIFLETTTQSIAILTDISSKLRRCQRPLEVGVLVECDASIKAIIVKLDSERNDIIVEDLDDEHLVIKETKLEELRQRLNQTLKTTLREAESSDSE